MRLGHRRPELRAESSNYSDCLSISAVEVVSKVLVDHVGEVEIVLPVVVAEVIAEHAKLCSNIREVAFEPHDP